MTLPWMMMIMNEMLILEFLMVDMLMMEVLMMVNEVNAVRKPCLEVELFRSGCMSTYFWMVSCSALFVNVCTHEDRGTWGDTE